LGLALEVDKCFSCARMHRIFDVQRTEKLDDAEYAYVCPLSHGVCGVRPGTRPTVHDSMPPGFAPGQLVRKLEVNEFVRMIQSWQRGDSA